MAIHISLSEGSQMGVAKLVAIAEEQRVLLTDHDRVVAVIDAPGRLDRDLERLWEAAETVVKLVADLAADGAGRRWSLEEVCDHLGLDSAVVRERAGTDPGR